MIEGMKNEHGFLVKAESLVWVMATLLEAAQMLLSLNAMESKKLDHCHYQQKEVAFSVATVQNPDLPLFLLPPPPPVLHFCEEVWKVSEEVAVVGMNLFVVVVIAVIVAEQLCFFSHPSSL